MIVNKKNYLLLK